MILSIDSSLKNFKSLAFQPGLNILLADTKDASASKKTRNSAGKTSFVLIMDFLLGANCDKNSLFQSDALYNEFFSMKFAFGNDIVEVKRSGSAQNKIFVLSGEQFLPLPLSKETSSNRKYITLADWRKILAHKFFNLPLYPNDTDFKDKYSPTYRAMLKYFLRLDSDGGFQHPNKNSNNQQAYSWQACLSYLFGLEWRVTRQFQKVRDKEKALEVYKRAANGGVFGDVVESIATLRPKVVIAEQRAKERRKEIENFQVLETYKDLSDKAAKIQRSMQELTRRLVSLKETQKFLQEAIELEKPASQLDIYAMYKASGIELPTLALRRFEEVKAFQKSIIENRKLHLQTELDETDREIAYVQDKLSSEGQKRKHILTTLEGKGAFEDLIEMQRDLARLDADHATLLKRFEAAESLESDKAELKVDRIELQRRLQADHNTHSEKLNLVIIRIANLIAALYGNREGNFEVSASENGPTFKINISGDRGTGIRNMEVFCMDIALFEATSRNFQGPSFLIHDSHLFDGVDARQISTAIKIGKEMAGVKYQYIVTLNSDVFGNLDFPDELKIEEHILPTRLSDEGEMGGLFGKRFD
ncbi:MAG: DUF2326 domain-containing protein [Rhodobacteraceae bacterium]|nr:DUF2326 domain-containing protein [Paracoccaceae bacterium]